MTEEASVLHLVAESFADGTLVGWRRADTGAWGYRLHRGGQQAAALAEVVRELTGDQARVWTVRTAPEDVSALRRVLGCADVMGATRGERTRAALDTAAVCVEPIAAADGDALHALLRSHQDEVRLRVGHAPGARVLHGPLAVLPDREQAWVEASGAEVVFTASVVRSDGRATETVWGLYGPRFGARTGSLPSCPCCDLAEAVAANQACHLVTGPVLVVTHADGMARCAQGGGGAALTAVREALRADRLRILHVPARTSVYGIVLARGMGCRTRIPAPRSPVARALPVAATCRCAAT